MKILFLSGQYPPSSKGGGEISTHLIAQALVARGHEVTVITESKTPQRGLLDGVQIVRHPLGLTAKPLFERPAAVRSALRLQQVAKLNSFDVIHAHDFHSALVLAELIRAHVVSPNAAAVTIRDYAAISGDTNYILSDGSVPKKPMSLAASWHSYRVKEATWPRKLGRFLQYALNVRYRAWAFSQIPNRVFISRAERHEMHKHLKPAARERVIYNPVSPEYLREVVVAGKPNTVSYVGRVEEYKGVRVLLQAWQIVIKQIPAGKLVITGTGAQELEYKVLVEQLGIASNVEFIGQVPYERMLDLYDASTVVVAPHLWLEPFGRAVAEGMARGKVVVASNAGGPPELVTAGLTGYLCQRGSVSELAAKLLEVLTLQPAERARVGEAARDWVNRNLSLQEISQQYEELYQVPSAA